MPVVENVFGCVELLKKQLEYQYFQHMFRYEGTPFCMSFDMQQGLIKCSKILISDISDPQNVSLPTLRFFFYFLFLFLVLLLLVPLL